MLRHRMALREWWASRFGRWLTIVTGVALAVRVAWVLVVARSPVGFSDPLFYEFNAINIARGDGYILANGDPTAYYPVGYPAIAALPVWIMDRIPGFENVPIAIGLFQALLGAVTVALLGFIGRRLVDGRVGIAAAVVAALFPSQIYYTAAILSETWFNFLLVLAVAILVLRRGDVVTRERILAAGLVLGLAVLTRPLALFLIPFAALAWWIARRGRRDVLRLGAGLLVGVLIVVVPWTVRNAVVMEELVPISTNTGDNLCIGHNPVATGAFQLPDYCFEGYEERLTTEQELARNRALTDRGLEYALENPHRAIPLLWWRAFWTFVTDDEALAAIESYGQDPYFSFRAREILTALANGYYFSLLAFAAIGIVALWRGRTERRLLYLAALAAMFVAPLPFFGDARFKVPFTLLCVVPAAVVLVAVPRITRALTGSVGDPVRR